MLERLGKKQFVPVSHILIIVFLVGLVVLVGRGVTGFTTSLIKLQEAAANSTYTKAVIENLEKNTAECTVTLNRTAELFNSCRTDLEVKKTENSRLAGETAVRESNITTYINSVAILQKEVAELRGLSNNLAVTICCLRRYVLEDDSLKYYYIQENKTYCVSQLNQITATKEFSC